MMTAVAKTKPGMAKIAWWTFGLSLYPVAFSVFHFLKNSFFFDNRQLDALGTVLGYAALAVIPAALVTGIIALVKKVRVWPVWVGVITAAFFFAFWVYLYSFEPF